MAYPDIGRAVGAEHERDLLRDAARSRGGRGDATGPHRWYRLWLRLSGYGRTGVPAPQRRTPAPATPPVQLPRPRPALDAVIDLSSPVDGPVMLIGEARGERSPRVGWSGGLAWRGPADPDGEPDAAGTVVHAVNDTGYPLCGATRVTHVLLSRAWAVSWPGACRDCAAALEAAPTA